MNPEVYADQIADWLAQLGYTHCFFVAGGNVMHLLNSLDKKLECIPVVHEVSAGIAAEYFNEIHGKQGKRAVVLVTAGPGLTNLITSIAGAFQESRELLVLGGQVKTSDLSTPGLRQMGIQEIDGTELVSSITKASKRILSPISRQMFVDIVKHGAMEKPGPIFLEIPLDVQAHPTIDETAYSENNYKSVQEYEWDRSIVNEFLSARRPVLLLGGGISRRTASLNYQDLRDLPFPIMTTWNGADRYSSREKNYWGRPNTWGQRYSNILLQQADFVLAIGTRLGLQQTGFNWEGFVPNGKVVQIEIDENELNKGRPRIYKRVLCDADRFLEDLIAEFKKFNYSNLENRINDWLDFGNQVKSKIPLSEDSNNRFDDYFNPYDFIIYLSKLLKSGDVIIPSSSGGAMTVTMQSLLQPKDSIVITNKSLASMGYGLAGAIGSAIATSNRVIHIEGDGGFAQNLQEMGTVMIRQLPIKTFLFVNRGYASIRMTQKSYYNGHYIGCDENTGLGLPNWKTFFLSYGIRTMKMHPKVGFDDKTILDALEDALPCVFLVPLAHDQTFFPKIGSRVTESGSMESNPLHKMSPDLPTEIEQQVIRYL